MAGAKLHGVGDMMTVELGCRYLVSFGEGPDWHHEWLIVGINAGWRFVWLVASTVLGGLRHTTLLTCLGHSHSPFLVPSPSAPFPLASSQLDRGQGRHRLGEKGRVPSISGIPIRLTLLVFFLSLQASTMNSFIRAEHHSTVTACSSPHAQHSRTAAVLHATCVCHT